MRSLLPVEILLTLVAAVYSVPSLYFTYPGYYENIQTHPTYQHQTHPTYQHQTHPTYQHQTHPTYQHHQHPAALLQNIKNQFHTQDELGQYTYGYNDGVSSKIESKSADGTTQGSYSYLDSNGIIQNVNYMADDANGFVVSATNLPMAPPSSAVPAASSSSSSTVVVAPARQQEKTIATVLMPQQIAAAEQPKILTAMTVQQTEIKTAKDPSGEIRNNEAEESTTTTKSSTITRDNNSTITTTTTATNSTSDIPIKNPTSSPAPQAVVTLLPPAPQSDIGYNPLFAHIGPYRFYEPPSAPALVSVAAAYDDRQQYHAAIPSIGGPVYSQYHSQDELGQYSYGYSGGPSSKAEVKTSDGITRGGYSYVDPNGIIQKVSYISDPVNGFRVAGTNLPFPSYPDAFVDPNQYYQQPNVVELNLNQISDNDDDKSNSISSD